MKAALRQLERDQVVIPASHLTAPLISWVAGRVFQLEAAYSYDDGPRRITAPAGFHFDLSSVPRALWWLIAPFELSIVAPLLHDFLYKYRGEPPPGAVVPPHRYERSEVDDLFRRVMEKEGVARWRRLLGYVAARVFGSLAWPSLE